MLRATPRILEATDRGRTLAETESDSELAAVVQDRNLGATIESVTNLICPDLASNARTANDIAEQTCDWANISPSALIEAMNDAADLINNRFEERDWTLNDMHRSVATQCRTQTTTLAIDFDDVNDWLTEHIPNPE